MATDASQQSIRGAGSLSVSTIGEDLMIAGDVRSKGEIHLDGRVQGDVHCTSLVLGENSRLEGSVIAEDLVILGRLVGSVRALRVMLQSRSHVEADLLHNSLAIEQGAYFEGQSRCCDNPLSLDQEAAEARLRRNGRQGAPNGTMTSGHPSSDHSLSRVV